MDDRQRQIYQSDGDRYEALIAREDYQNSILKALNGIVDPAGLDVLDLGAGTGRLAVMLAPQVKSIHAFDISSGMLQVCRERLAASGLSNWQVGVADHRRLPLAEGSADVVVSGWSVSYLAVWNEGKTGELDVWLAEMRRVLRSGGTIILFESLGTGNENPVRLEHMESTYWWLDANGFETKWIRTDYRFESVAEAAELAGFFFGEDMENRVRGRQIIVLPECTGVWWKRL
jgi:ubiquinone/menaquinone biosynthesis C-methylase UbiE